MSELTDAQYLELFPAWLGSLGDDALTLAAALREESTPDAAHAPLIAGLNYIFKSLDLIPDGIDDLGYLDDAFIVRVGASAAVAAGASVPGLAQLGAQARAVESFLKSDYARLVHYFEGLGKTSARGRSVEDILGNEMVRKSFLNEIDTWSAGYEKPTFNAEPRTLIKLRSFLNAKLP
jgi:uncharacterized membrane protein YkvA (DUF1232 family)